MKTLPLSREELLVKYNLVINDILDFCDWKTSFSGDEVCGIIHKIMDDAGAKLAISSVELFTLYSEKVDNLGFKDEDWREQYGIPEICNLVYDILEEKG